MRAQRPPAARPLQVELVTAVVQAAGVGVLGLAIDV